MASRRLPNVQLYFRFYGECFDPDEVTRQLGVSPTLHFRPGDPILPDGRGRRRHPGWMVKVGGHETLEITDMLQELRKHMNVSGATVRQLCDDLDVEAIIVCGVGQGESTDAPVMFFPSDFVAWAADMGASINVDVIF